MVAQQMEMKTFATSLCLLLVASAAVAQPARNGQPASVSVTVEVEVTRKIFTPGVYAGYAESLLGILVGTEPSVTTNVTSVKIEPVTSNKGVKLSERQTFGKTALSTPLVKDATIKKKASEAAGELMELREQRANIVTGNTDATYSGQALGDAVKYLTNREKELLTLFEGTSSTIIQRALFIVTPDKDHLKCVVFRLDDNGIHDPMEMTGKPWYMEFIPMVEEEEDEEPALEESVTEPENNSKRKKSRKTPEPATQTVREFIPGICTVVLYDGNKPVAHLDVDFPQLEKETVKTIKIQ